MRLDLFINVKHRRSRGFGWRVTTALSPNEFGLIGLYGIVVTPRAGKPWREKRKKGSRPYHRANATAPAPDLL
jgi:RNA-directed DNA polymerase